MKNTKYLVMAMLLIVSVSSMIASCASQGEPKDKITYERIISLLESKNLEVKELETLKQPFFAVDSKVLEVNGDNLQVLEYKSEDAAKKDAGLVSKEGTSAGTSMASWIAPPHFYQRQNFIVLYLGSNSEIISALEEFMGPQFAGESTPEINNFEQCEAMGYPIMESYPRQCMMDGQTFTEEIKGEGKMPGDYTQEIETPKGKLFLSYHGDGKATLTGVLQRSTPCTEFEVAIISTRDFPTSNVNINIHDRNKEEVCIQMVGEPQDISEEILSVSESTKYIITYEEEKLFEGKIGDSK